MSEFEENIHSSSGIFYCVNTVLASVLLILNNMKQTLIQCYLCNL